MKNLAMFRQKIGFWLVAFLPLIVIGVLFGARQWIGQAIFCITDFDKKILNIAGYDFEVKETDCAVIGSAPDTVVYATKKGEWKKVLLMEYDSTNDGEIPQITQKNQNEIEISLGPIGSLYYTQESLGDLKVTYHFDHIAFPFETIHKP